MPTTTVGLPLNEEMNFGLECAVNDLKTSKKAYVTEALRRRLVADGYLKDEDDKP